MFAVIGKKIFDKLCGSYDFNVANDSTFGSELVYNGTFESGIGNWWTSPQPPRGYSWDESNERMFVTTQGTYQGAAYCVIDLVAGSTYAVEYTYDSAYETSVDIGSEYNTNNIYEGVKNVAGTGTANFCFTPDASGSMFLTFNNWATTYGSGGYLESITVKKISGLKVSPVIIPQGTAYPATTFEIANVDNFITKSSSLASCDVSLRIACFADNYNTTYNQSKAVVEALDYYSVTYTEDGVSYTAKFRFVSLDDDYYKLPEKFYKNLIFNCLITKN
jgi:hypothetical protein